MARLARVGAEADLSRKRFTKICKYGGINQENLTRY
jgi:hypothetical protein